MSVKQRFDHFAHIHTWTHFILGSFAFLAVATFFEFFNQRATDRAGSKFLSAALFSVEVLGAGLALGLAFAGVRRLIHGQERSVQMRETALWIACVFGVVCLAARMLP